MFTRLNVTHAGAARLAGLVALCLALVLATTASRVSASEGMDDFVQLLQSGVGEEVLLTFVEQSPVAYSPTVDEIVYLRDLGASDTLIQALMARGEALRLAAAKAEGLTVAQAPAPAPVAVTASNTITFADNQIASEVATGDLEQPVYQAPPMTAVVTTPPPADVNVSFFYQAMAPYGTWRCVDDTWVWQPTATVLDRSWRPYLSRGHWVSSDWGWAWHSDYSWGWAPFHYGRWSANPTYGWVWTPDTVWAPAWVNWRTNNTHFGWAPLPPAARYSMGVGFSYHGSHVGLDFNFGLGARDYCFVPADRFCESALPTYALMPMQVTNIYSTTILVTDNYRRNDHRLINTGPSVDRVQKAYGRPIRQVKIVDANTRPGQTLHGETLLKDSMAVYKPAVASVAPVTPPAVIARQETAKKREALLVQRDAQKTAAATEQAKREQDRKGAQTRQDALATERKAKAAADTARQDQLKQESATKRQQAAVQAAEATKREQAQKDAQNAAAAQRQAQAAAEASAREQARRDAAARQDQAAAQRQAQAAAQAAAREQTQRDAAAQRDAQAQQNAAASQRQAQAAAQTAAREQTQRDAAARQDQAASQRQAQAAAKTAAREQTQRDAAAQRDAQQTQQRAERDAQRQDTARSAGRNRR